jgi:hypothetical protein
MAFAFYLSCVKQVLTPGLRNSLSFYRKTACGPRLIIASIVLTSGVDMFRVTVIAFLMTAAALWSQEYRGSIRGRVTDPTGAIVAGAKVKASNQSTGVVLQAATNADGNYQVPFLLPGEYSVSVEHAGFKTVERPGIRVETNTNIQIDLRLELGGSTESVTVRDESPLLNTEGADLGQVVDKTYVTDVVTSVYRNSINLSRLAAGITGAPQGTYTSDNMSQFSINGGGGSNGGNEVIVDGVPNTIPMGGGTIVTVPTVDSVEEMKVQTTMFDASYGRSNGGAINISTKAGGNQLHGNANFFKRWAALNANSWFNNKNGVDIAPINYRLFGGFFSGPVYLPKFYDGRNKTFFAVSYENDNDVRDLARWARVPTDVERNGDFSQTLSRNGAGIVGIYDPASTTGKQRTPFPGSVIPAARLNTMGKAVLTAFPLPNQTVRPQINVNNWYSDKTYRVGQGDWSVRIDHSLSDRQRLFGRFNKVTRDQNAEALIPGVQAYGGSGADIDNYRQWRYSLTLDDTITFSPSLVGSIRYGFTRRYNYEYWGAVDMDPRQLNVPSVILNNQIVKGWPEFSIGESIPSFGSRYTRNANYVHTLFTTFTKMKAGHSLKFGIDYRLTRNNQASQGTAGAGSWSFSPTFTQSDYSNNNTQQTSGTGMASLLLGGASGGQFGYASPLSLQQHYLGAFVQDEWRITPRLSLSLGLRYELELPYTERYNRMTFGFDPGAPLPITVPGMSLHGGVMFAGVNGNPRGQGYVDSNNFGPRAGIAFRADARTVVRAGYGLFYAGQTYNDTFLGGIGTFDAMTSYNGSIDGGATMFSNISNPYPNGLVTATGSSLGVMAQAGNSLDFSRQSRVSPYSQQWQLSVQRQLPSRTVLEVAYVGMLTLKGFETRDANEKPDIYLPLGSAENNSVPNPFYGILPATSILGQSTTITQSRLWKAYPQFTSLNVHMNNGATSSYQALQTRVEKRLSRGLSVLGTFTFSKLLKHNLESIVNDRNYRSIASTDQPKLFRVAATYELPFRFDGDGMNRVLRIALKGWTVTGLLTMESGLPIGISGNNGRPVMIEDPRTSGSIQSRMGDVKDSRGYPVNPYLIRTAFKGIPQYTITPQSPYVSWARMPRQSVLNSSIYKTFAIYERLRLQVRMETINTTNHPYFNGLSSTNIDNPTSFGVINSATNSRQMQGALKLLF